MSQTSRGPRRFDQTLLAALALAALSTGCERQLDIERLQSVIEEGLEEQLELEIAEVECPGEVTIEADDTFDCTATAEAGGTLTVQVTQSDDEGNVAWEVSQMVGILDLEGLERQIENGLSEQAGIAAEVDCGGRLRGSRTDDTFQCTAEGTDGSQGTITITVTDDRGNVSWVLDPVAAEP